MDNKWLIADENEKLFLRNILGIDFDDTLNKLHPEITASLPENNGGYCLVCYYELDSEPGTESFCLDECRHTFCKSCTIEMLKNSLQSLETGLKVQCMQADCNMTFTHHKFLDILEGQYF